jgi:hypothetical protein
VDEVDDASDDDTSEDDAPEDDAPVVAEVEDDDPVVDDVEDDDPVVDDVEDDDPAVDDVEDEEPLVEDPEPVSAATEDEATDEPEPEPETEPALDEPADDDSADDEDLADAVVVSHDDAAPPVTLVPRDPAPDVTRAEAPDDGDAWFTTSDADADADADPAPEPDPDRFVADLFRPTTPVVPAPEPEAAPGSAAVPPPLPEPVAPEQLVLPEPAQPEPGRPAGGTPSELASEAAGEVAYDDVTPGPEADDGDPGDAGYGYGYPLEPATTAITMRPTAELIRAHRRRERRRTLTFLGIFLGVLAMGLASFTFFQGSWTWPFGTAAASAPVCPTPTQTAPPAKDVTVKVYNASSRQGLARTVAGTLKKRGFEIGEVGNDPQEAKVPGVAVIRHGPAGLEAAKTVAAFLEGKVTFVPDERVSESVDLVLGKKFTKVRSAAAAAKALTPTLATVPAGCSPTGGTGSPSPSGSTSPAGATTPATTPAKTPSPSKT